MKIATVIFGSPDDPHVSSVCSALKGRGVDAFVSDRCDTIAHKYSGGKHEMIGPLAEHVGDCDGIVIWRRLKPAMGERYEAFAGNLTRRRFWETQWADFTDATIYMLGLDFPTSVINSGSLQVGLKSKAVQLRLAQAVGFKVPLTLLGSSVEEVRDFPEEEILFKPLNSQVYDDKLGTVPVAVLSKAALLENPSALMRDPNIFQRYTRKSYELRVHVVGDTIIPVRIDSQISRISAIDWRVGIANRAMYSMGEIAMNEQHALRRFMELFALDIGVFDFIVDESGQSIFLECNPAGQWMWLDNFVQAGVSESVAELIIHRGRDLAAQIRTESAVSVTA